MAVPGSSAVKPQTYDYFLILDFEANCEKKKKIVPQEIVEFPVIKINSRTLLTEATFHQYVEPEFLKLTPFCTELTGITEAMVNGQPKFKDAFEKFKKWMLENKLLEPNVKFIFVTCGNWDLERMLPTQCQLVHTPVPNYCKQWLNIQKAYTEIIPVTTKNPTGMVRMLQGLGLRQVGRKHSGIDDARNIGNILCELVRRGYVAKPTKCRP